jgi:hypothetical protein
MEQSPCQADNHLASQEIPCLLWNSNVHYHVTKCCSRVISTPALYSGDPGFKSRLGDSNPEVFLGCCQSRQENTKIVP